MNISSRTSPQPEGHDGRRRTAGDSNIGKRVSDIGLEIAEITGVVDDLVKLGTEQIARLRAVVAAARVTEGSNAELEASMNEAGETAQTARAVLSESAKIIAETLSRTTHKMESLANGVFSTTSSIDRVRETIEKVQKNSAAIQAIAFETRLIALNAGVEAARAGAAGHGFAVISNAIRSLSDQVATISNQNHENLGELGALLQGLTDRTHDNVATARSAIADSSNAAGTTQRLQSLVSSVEDLTARIDAMTRPVRQNIESGLSVRDNLKGLVQIVKESEVNLARARDRTQNILGIGEDFMAYVTESGIETPDTAVVELAMEGAQAVCDLFERALKSGEIGLSDLFDETYRPIPGTDPQQVLTRFTEFTDRHLPAIQEPMLKRNPRIVFCAAIDRNGYLPTHNKIYSQPQGDDPVWNAANCRNRRIFDDRTGLSAGRNTRKFLLQTYRRDMGNRQFVLMKDASAPVKVAGRHWGGFRIGFKA
ncbi:MAG: methyl-accepting chemotaxis protein [Hyphomicrobiales bacterium]|nr:MAG: methyl-accepting chemotaxis protein [Hyphomicrobiales bacterium]